MSKVNATTIIKNCAYCGNPIKDAKRSTKRYCNGTCSKADQRAKKKVTRTSLVVSDNRGQSTYCAKLPKLVLLTFQEHYASLDPADFSKYEYPLCPVYIQEWIGSWEGFSKDCGGFDCPRCVDKAISRAVNDIPTKTIYGAYGKHQDWYVGVFYPDTSRKLNYKRIATKTPLAWFKFKNGYKLVIATNDLGGLLTDRITEDTLRALLEYLNSTLGIVGKKYHWTAGKAIRIEQEPEPDEEQEEKPEKLFRFMGMRKDKWWAEKFKDYNVRDIEIAKRDAELADKEYAECKETIELDEGLLSLQETAVPSLPSIQEASIGLVKVANSQYS